MKKNVWVPLHKEEDKVVILVDNPHDLQKIDGIRLNYPGRGLQFCVALKSDIMEYIKLFTQDEKEVASMDDILSQLEVEDQEIEEAESAMGEEDSAVVQLVNKIILDAHARNASDIHIEPMPGKENTVVRVRVDGSCAVYQTIPFGYRNALVLRIKIMSDLDIAERRRPQDGKIKFKKYSGKDIEIRVATVPTAGGLEDVVMRILELASRSRSISWGCPSSILKISSASSHSPTVLFSFAVPPAPEKPLRSTPPWDTSTNRRPRSGRRKIPWKSPRRVSDRCR